MSTNINSRAFRGDNYFCGECGSFIGTESSATSSCYVCRSPLQTNEALEVVYPTISQAVRGPRRQKKDESKILIQYDCPECGHHEMEYWVMQTRGADEGSSVFYQCKKCNYTIKENN